MTIISTVVLTIIKCSVLVCVGSAAAGAGVASCQHAVLATRGAALAGGEGRSFTLARSHTHFFTHAHTHTRVCTNTHTLSLAQSLLGK